MSAPERRELDGPWRAAIADEELRRVYPDEDFDDSGWERVQVPHHWRSVPAFSGTDGPVIYRTAFASPDAFGPGAEDAELADEPRRTWLTLDGAFYTSDVWLDGSYLGDTEGYFFPHTFEISDAIANQQEHVLGIEVACRRETDRAAKRNLTGVFQHWDLLDQDWHPGGLWRPVRLEQTGPVRIKHFRALCRDASEQSATVFIRAVLDTIETRSVTIETSLERAKDAPIDPTAPRSRLLRREVHALATGENRLEWTYDIARPDLWWPHALGDQPLYDLHVQVFVGDADERDGPMLLSDERTRRMGLRSVSVEDWMFSINGERLFLKGSNQGPTRMALAEATAEDFDRDVELAIDANLDFLRVHAHVSRPELYAAADRRGLLLWQDMPLQWGYHRSIRQQARRQAREMVDLLAHHPSLFTWCGHNEPMAIDVEPVTIADPVARGKLVTRALISQMLPAWNKSVLDYSIKRVIEKTDGSRPVSPHSGIFPHPPQLEGTDTHSYFGWYYGDERQFEPAMRAWPRLARFVTEFGAQAIPEDASFLEPERWPDLDWDRAYRTHAFQKIFMDNYVPAADYDSFDEWRAATQAYQGQVIKSHIEVLRRLKYHPCGGFAQFNFADGYASATWSVLGHDRRPKQGYGVLADVCRPVIVVADRLPATVRPGDPLGLDIHVVNDARIDLEDTIATAHLLWGEAAGDGAAPPDEPTPDTHVWRWQGDVPADSVVRVATIQAVVPDAPGPLVLALTLAGPVLDTVALPGRSPTPVTNRYTTTITG